MIHTISVTLFTSINSQLYQIQNPSPCPPIKWITVSCSLLSRRSESRSRVSKLTSMFCVTLSARLSVDPRHTYDVTALAPIEKAHAPSQTLCQQISVGGDARGDLRRRRDRNQASTRLKMGIKRYESYSSTRVHFWSYHAPVQASLAMHTKHWAKLEGLTRKTQPSVPTSRNFAVNPPREHRLKESQYP